MQEVQGTPAAAVLPAKRALELQGGCEMLEAEPARGGCRPASPPGGSATEAGGAVPPSGDAGTEAEVPADLPQPAKPKLQARAPPVPIQEPAPTQLRERAQ